MKKSIKKLLSVALVFAIMISASFTSVSAVDSGTYETGIVDRSVDIITTDAFREVFYPSAKSSDEVQIDHVTYSYKVLPRKEALLADVLLVFILTTGAKEYHVFSSGTVDAYTLSSGDILWEGPLSGCIEINNTTYKVLAGFSKIDCDPKIQVSVTIQAASVKNAIHPIVFTFGEEVISMQIYNELAENVRTQSMESLSESFKEITESNNRSGTMKNVGYSYATFDSGFSISGYAQRSGGFFNSGTNQFAVSIRSYCNNIENYFSSAGSVLVSINSFDIELIRGGYTTNSFSWIDGIERFNFDVGSFGSGATYIKPLFEDGMSLLGIPTSTISATLDGLQGSVNKDCYTDDTTVSVSFGLLQSADFDDSDKGVPIVFQLTRNQSNYTGNSAYTFVTRISYRAILFAPGAPYPAYIYINGYDTSKTVYVSLA